MAESKLFKEKAVLCNVCRFRCALEVGAYGRCGVRCNVGGKLFLSGYGVVSKSKIVSTKDLFLTDVPDVLWLKVGGVGCNLRCSYCDNWEVAWDRSGITCSSYNRYEPDELVDYALSRGCKGIFFAYSEPVVMAEFVLDVFRVAKEKGLLTGMHTNGTGSAEFMNRFLNWCDYFVVDVKAFTKECYRRITGNSYDVSAPLEFCERLFEDGAHLEVVTPVIPGFNSHIFEMRSLARWMVYKLSPEVPWHLLPFTPTPNLFTISAPSPELMGMLERMAGEEGLSRVVLHI